MNDQTDHLDQTDKESLTYTLSDEALEAAAGTERGANNRCWFFSMDPHPYPETAAIASDSLAAD